MPVTTEDNKLIQVVQETGLEKQNSDKLILNFTPFFEQFQEWDTKARALVVTSEDQVKEMAEARIGRLALSRIRVEADKTRKALKADSLQYGNAVQSVYNFIEASIKPIEDHLKQQEKFAEIQEANRKEALTQLRTPEIEEYQEFIPYGLDLGAMSEEDYSKLINGAKLQKAAKVEEELKVEAARLQEIEDERIEQDRVKKELEELQAARIESERLAKIESDKRAKAEADRKAQEAKEIAARQKKEAEEKKAHEAELQKERDAKAKIESELQAKKDEEAKAEADRKAQAKKSLLAPDKIKLKELALMINQIDLPTLQSKEADTIIKNVRELLNKTSNYVQQQADKL